MLPITVILMNRSNVSAWPFGLIEAIRPDVLVKGADYTLDGVVGGDVVQRYGGRVYLAKLTPGHSTTDTIARIAAEELPTR